MAEVDPDTLFAMGVVVLVSGGMILFGSSALLVVLEIAGKLSERTSINMLYRMATGICLLVAGAFITVVR